MSSASCKQYEEHPFEFVNLMKINMDRYTTYLNPPDEGNGNIHLINIPLLAGRSYKLHLLLLLAAGHLEQSALPRFKRIVESAVYYSVINRIPTNQTERAFIGWCSGIRKLRTQDELEKFVAESMLPVILDWKKTHKQYFLMLGLHSMQQYRVKFVMAKILAYIDALRLGETEPGNLASYMASGVEIEHIMPVKCDDKAAYGLTSEEFDQYINRLGNLTLLENSINKSIHNSAYDAKRLAYQHSKFYLTKSIPMLSAVGSNTAMTRTNEKLQYWPEWNKNSIDERQQMLFNISEEIWGITNSVFA